MENQLIPKQITGNQTNFSAKRECTDIGEAILFYRTAKMRLLDVNHWSKICNSALTTFQLTDKEGLNTSELVDGSLIKINIPGPGTSLGNGFDWVGVEEVAHQSETDMDEWFVFRVRPVANPAEKAATPAHFFTSEATSTFLVKRVGNSVFAEVHGRNETANNEQSGMLDNLRNTIVGGAAKIGFSYPQWKLLVEGIVRNENGH